MMHADGMKFYKDEKVWVCWDIGSCPVPELFDPRLVGSRIESALRKEGYSGPLTITALGNLRRILRQTPDVLPALSSTGILLNHAPGFIYIFEEFLRWTWENRAPATLLLITGDECHVDQWSPCFSTLRAGGYNTLHAYPSKMVTSRKGFHWESILLEDLGEKVVESRKTGKPPCRFFCSLCDFAGESFEDFTTHLKSIDHALRDLKTVKRPQRERKVNHSFNASKFIDNRSEDQSKDWSIEEEEDRMSL